MTQPPTRRDQNPGWLVRTPRRLQMAVFVLVGAVSLLGVFGIENAEMYRRHAALERNGSDIAAALRQLDTEHEIYLRASAALLAAQDTITGQGFDQLQSELNFKLYRQGSLGVGWAPRIPARRLPQAEAALQAQAGPAFRFRRWPGNDGSGTVAASADAFPVVFFDPLDTDKAAALGFDMYSEPNRRAAMDQAAASDAPVATGRVRPVPDNGTDAQPGFLIYMPVFGRPDPRDLTSADRQTPHRQAPQTPIHGPLRGFVYMPFRAPALLAMASQMSAGEKIRVAAYDGEVAPDRLLASSGFSGGRKPDPAELGLGRHPDPGSELIETVTIAGRPWQLVVSSARPTGLSLLSQITILSGLIVAVLLAVLIRMTYQKIDEERALLEWQASEAGIRNSLTRELNHRVKNTLATVLSIVTLTRRRETDLDSYVASLSGRIRALSATHDLLTSSEWSSIELRQIILAELAPYLGANDDHVSLAGPEIRLAPNDALTLGLAVHELATNAAKYGALSVLTGRIAISWAQLSEAVVEIHWQESGGPEVMEPSKRGFGRELIEKILARELDSPVKLSFAPGGLQCAFRVPLRKPGPFVLRAGQRPPVAMAS
jgi:two-component sensor histidine kinase/CHASE1-domain containing sensor protein